LNGVAHAYRVSRAAIIAANRLQPPYELKAGSRLVIPDAGPTQQRQVFAAPLPPNQAANAPPQAEAVAAPQPNALSPPPSSARALPDIVPLDGPAPKQAAAEAPPANGAPPPVMPPRNPAAALPLPGEAPQAVSVQPSAAAAGAGGERFTWPVQGRILANYGTAAGGGRNDGINIGAPRGTPVRSVDAGVVAYVGNEVKGYGNLVLVKHDNGWISAYAHLDDPMVKVGDKVASGQVIAKVGSTGSVGEPQLHFELRRGRKPVDPREYLAPAPSAGRLTRDPAG
jgi:murein DD-endopeptidase MepM/ murein hydrolase activator NlpD